MSTTKTYTTKTWIEDIPGMYTIVPTRGVRAGKTCYWARVWIKSRTNFAYFYLGLALKESKRRMNKILADPEAALAEREREREVVRTFEQVADLFLANYQSRGGSRHYHDRLRAPRAFMGDQLITDITPAMLDRYLAERRDVKTKGVPRKVNDKIEMVGAGRRKISESTLRKEVIALGTMFKWAKRRGLVQVNSALDYEKPKEPADARKATVAPDQERALLALLPPLERDVVEWALYSGMRQGEILGMAWRSNAAASAVVDRAAGVVHVVKTKTGKARNVPLSLSLKLGAILDRRPQSTRTDLVFHDGEGKRLDVDRINGVLEAALKAAGIPKVRGVLWNLFRKTCVSRLYNSGKVMPQDEAAWMGHSMAVAVKHYHEYSPSSAERAAGVLDVVPGRVTVPPTVPPTAASA